MTTINKDTIEFIIFKTCELNEIKGLVNNLNVLSHKLNAIKKDVKAFEFIEILNNDIIDSITALKTMKASAFDKSFNFPTTHINEYGITNIDFDDNDIKEIDAQHEIVKTLHQLRNDYKQICKELYELVGSLDNYANRFNKIKEIDTEYYWIKDVCKVDKKQKTFYDEIKNKTDIVLENIIDRIKEYLEIELDNINEILIELKSSEFDRLNH
jgi:DNA repair ATPase RecN